MHGKEGVVGGRRAGVGGRLARLVSEKNSFFFFTKLSGFLFVWSYGAQAHVLP